MRHFGLVSTITLYIFLGILGAASAQVETANGWVRIPGHRTVEASITPAVGAVPAAQEIPLTIALQPQDPEGLSTLIGRLYDPKDSLYHHFLTPTEYANDFGPTPQEYAAVERFASAEGLTITGTSPNRLFLKLEAPSAAVESAFGVDLIEHETTQGRYFHAPDANPAVPASIAPIVLGVLGLDNSAVLHPQYVKMSNPTAANKGTVPNGLPEASSAANPLQIGSGEDGALSPSDIKTAYNLNSVSDNGTGQTLAVFELDGYNPSDTAAYASHYGIPDVPQQIVSVDGQANTEGSGAVEVTLDIELQMAVAQGASKILVYEGPNSGSGAVDTYNDIATQDVATEISSSWGLAEDQSSSSEMQAENNVFEEMAAQGQSIFASAGDSGAYDDGSTLSVDDPASQPYVTGVGGTTLATNGAGGTYNSETTWNEGGAGGGGISSFWEIPSWQQGVINSTSGASSTMRNVPDVSLDANPYTGFSVYFNGGWAVYGGTSCASPLWAAFTALVNQQRSANGLSPLGFADPPLYALAENATSYANDFHDITSGTNEYYSAVQGYDDATGIGSYNGANLLNGLSDTVTLPPNGVYRITPESQPGMALDVSGFVDSPETNVDIWYANYGVGQKWSLTQQSDKSYIIGAFADGDSAGNTSTERLDNTSGNTANGNPVRIYPNNNETPQRWYLIPNGNGYYRIVPKNATSQTLDITGGNSAGAGALTELYGYSGGTGQLFSFTSAVEPALQITGVTVSNITASGATVSWNTNVTATEYVAYGQNSSYGTATASAGDIFSDETHSVSLTGLLSGTTYHFQANSIDVAGGSASSSDATFTTVEAPPAAPSGLTATPGQGSIALAWNAVPGAIDYNVYRGTATGAEAQVPYKAGVTSTNFTDTSVTSGTPYYYTIAAVNNDGLGAQSSEVSAIPLTPLPAAVTGLTATPGTDSVGLTWAALSGASTYDIYRSTTSGGEGTTPYLTGISGTSATDSNVTAGTPYYYTVAGVNSAGPGAQSAEASATPLPPLPAQVTGLTAAPSTNSVGLSWTAVSGAATYDVYRSTTSGGEGTTPYLTGVTATSATDSNVTAGTPYYYTVAGVNSAGPGVQSAEASATPLPPLPVQVTGLTAAPSTNSVGLSWTAVSGAATYDVYRSTTSGGEGTTPYLTGITGTSTTDSNVTAGTPYYYTVAGVNTAGPGPQSAEASATVALPSVSGVVSLQDVVAGNMGQPIVFTLTPTGTTTGSVTNQTITLNAQTGAFTIPNVPPGTYTLGAKGSKWLRTDTAIDTTVGSVSGLNISLLGGDINGDNSVTLADYALFLDAYRSTTTSANWNANADLNCDGSVSLADYAIFLSNYRKTGDP